MKETEQHIHNSNAKSVIAKFPNVEIFWATGVDFSEKKPGTLKMADFHPCPVCASVYWVFLLLQYQPF